MQDLQIWVKNDWEQRSKRQPSIELQLLYIMEELGEVAEAIRKTSGSKTRKQKDVNLGAEFADLVISVVTLANHFNIDLDKEIDSFKDRLAKRHNQGF